MYLVSDHKLTLTVMSQKSVVIRERIMNIEKCIYTYPYCLLSFLEYNKQEDLNYQFCSNLFTTIEIQIVYKSILI